MPGITLDTARNWIGLYEAAGIDPGPKAVGDQFCMVLGPVDVPTGGSDGLDFCVTPACGGHNFQPGNAHISGLVEGPAGATATIKLYDGGTDLLSAAFLMRPNAPANGRVENDVDLSGSAPIAEGVPLRLECTALDSGATGLKGLIVVVTGIVVT